MTLCGFVLTVYGGVKIYYHDVFKGMTIQSKEIYAKDLAQMYKMFKRIAFFQRKHPEFIDCGRMQETQLKHMDTFDLKELHPCELRLLCGEKNERYLFPNRRCHLGRRRCTFLHILSVQRPQWGFCLQFGFTGYLDVDANGRYSTSDAQHYGCPSQVELRLRRRPNALV